MTILQDLSTASHDELLAQVAALKAKLAMATKPRRLVLKVGKAGGVSLYGMGKYPVTLYRSQWERLLNATQEIRDFIEANSDQLTTKD